MTSGGRQRSGLTACVAAAALSAIWPGAGHVALRARLRPTVVAATLVNVVAAFAVGKILLPVRHRADLAEVIADRQVFLMLGLGLAALAVTRLYTILDAAWLARPITGTRQQVVAVVATLALVVVATVPLAITADYIRQTDRMLERVFAAHEPEVAQPGPVTGDTDGLFDPVTTDAPTTTAPPGPFDGFRRVNVLLIGGDAGPDRYGMRTDTMVVVSIDPATGDSAMISVPRNLPRLPFPPTTPMGQAFPNGFDGLANAVYTYVDNRRELGGGGDNAALVVLKQGIAQLLGIPIHYYLVVDMAGFVQVVDSLGGIDLYIAGRVPSPGNPQGALHDVPEYIEVGQQHMDGTIALAYARSREGDSDYQRMARQRCVLGALADAASPQAVALGLPDLVTALGYSLRTDIPRSRLDEFVQLVDRFNAAGGAKKIRTLHLAPPTIDSANWTPNLVRALVAKVLDPDNVALELDPGVWANLGDLYLTSACSKPAP